MAHGVNVAANTLHLAPGLLQTCSLPFTFPSEAEVYIHVMGPGMYHGYLYMVCNPLLPLRQLWGLLGG